MEGQLKSLFGDSLLPTKMNATGRAVVADERFAFPPPTWRICPWCFTAQSAVASKLRLVPDGLRKLADVFARARTRQDWTSPRMTTPRSERQKAAIAAMQIILNCAVGAGSIQLRQRRTMRFRIALTCSDPIASVSSPPCRTGRADRPPRRLEKRQTARTVRRSFGRARPSARRRC